ncbi:MAG: T9SS type A sorting domain-containing protein [Chlorobi bacterium]|nr:T9SS type A sorting domain-containing protein [Chlorobiota bacterium]
MNRKNYFIIFAAIFFAFVANSQNLKTKDSNFDQKEKANKLVKTTESMKQNTSVKGVIFEDNFENDLGWTYEGGWERDDAVSEPDQAHSGLKILANPLGSDYENNMLKETVTSPVIDCSGQNVVSLSYWGFSGCEISTYDHLGVEVYDGASWVEIWSNDDWGGSTQEDEWTYYEFDVTDYAAGITDFQVRFYLGETDVSVQYSGWAVDDLIVSFPEEHDLGIVSVSPTTALPDNPITPSAIIRNFGGNDENTYNVEIEITDDEGAQVYIDNVDIAETIAVTQQKLVEMGTTWTPLNTGFYTVTATVNLAGDTYPDNDVMSVECMVSYVYLMGDEDVTTCTGLFYDSGGPDENYQPNEYYTMTFYPGSPGTMMQVEFIDYEVEGSTYDYLAIYNGEDITAELIDTHEGDPDDFYFEGQTITASNATGALTFEFTTDNSVEMPGWKAIMSCVNAITFHVTDGNGNDIENALVEVEGLAGHTNEEGNALFTLPEGDVDYTVTANFCDPLTDTYTVTGEPGQIVEVGLDCLSEYLVTFNAFENFGANAVVEGVKIEVDHMPTNSIWVGTTNENGEAEFVLPATDYEFSASAQGYIYSGTNSFSVSGDMDVDLPLEEDITAPTDLMTQLIDTAQGIVDFTWYAGFNGNLLVVDHDASNAESFTDDWGYIQPALDLYNINYTYFEADPDTYEGPGLALMQQYEMILWFTGEGFENHQTMTVNDETNLAEYLDGGGKLFFSSQDYVWDVYYQYPDYTFSSGQFPFDYMGLVSITQNLWTGNSIPHEGALGSLAEGMEFQCDNIYSGGLSEDMIFSNSVTDMLHVTGAPTGIAAVQSEDVVCWLGSIASVADEQMRADLMMGIFDFLAVGQTGKGNKSLESFNIFLDDMGTPVATEITDSTYQFTGLTPGQSYTAGVSATYTTGESDIATIDFTVPMITDIKENMNPGIHIFPNPSNGNFTIKANADYNVEVRDIAGKLILADKLTSLQTDINLREQKAGLYFIRLTNNETTYNFKIVLE